MTAFIKYGALNISVNNVDDDFYSKYEYLNIVKSECDSSIQYNIFNSEIDFLNFMKDKESKKFLKMHLESIYEKSYSDDDCDLQKDKIKRIIEDIKALESGEKIVRSKTTVVIERRLNCASSNPSVTSDEIIGLLGFLFSIESKNDQYASIDEFLSTFRKKDMDRLKILEKNMKIYSTMFQKDEVFNGSLEYPSSLLAEFLKIRIAIINNIYNRLKASKE